MMGDKKNDDEKGLWQMDGVRAGEDGPACIQRARDDGRLWVIAYNQGGHDCAGVDLGDLLLWLDSHPDVAAKARAWRGR